MKKLLLGFLALSATTLFAQKKANDVAKFDVESYDFGQINTMYP